MWFELVYFVRVRWLQESLSYHLKYVNIWLVSPNMNWRKWADDNEWIDTCQFWAWYYLTIFCIHENGKCYIKRLTPTNDPLLEFKYRASSFTTTSSSINRFEIVYRVQQDHYHDMWKKRGEIRLLRNKLWVNEFSGDLSFWVISYVATTLILDCPTEP